MFREWSSITGRGGGVYKTGLGGGGASEVLSLQKEGPGKVFSHSEGGTTSFEVV